MTEPLMWSRLPAQVFLFCAACLGLWLTYRDAKSTALNRQLSKRVDHMLDHAADPAGWTPVHLAPMAVWLRTWRRGKGQRTVHGHRGSAWRGS